MSRAPSPQVAAPRPSLIVPGGPRASGDAEADSNGFGVSILSAARDDHFTGTRPAKRPPPRARWNTLGWLMGTALSAAALIALAHWRSEVRPPATPRAQSPQVVAPARAAAPGAATSSPPVAAAAPVPATGPAQSLASVTQSASAPPPAASGPAPRAIELPEAPGAALRSLAARSTEEASGKPRPRPSTPTPAKPRDPDTELVAAVMAHSDGGARTKPQPLGELQRLHFSAELRQCRSGGSVAARDACVLAACEAKGYWGRTKSCPLAPPPPAPVERRPTKGSGQTLG